LILRAQGERVIQGSNTWNGNRFSATLSYVPTIKREAITRYPEDFQEYSLDATVIQVSSRVNFVKIDKGEDDSIRPGQAFEIHEVEGGSPVAPVAFARVLRSKPDSAILKILRYYREVLIEEGMIVRRVISPDS
jgi:hypothetical protein